MQLIAHPQSDWSPWTVTFSISRQAGAVRLVYDVAGDIDVLDLGPSLPARRTDALWRHTCLEWFVAEPLGPAYHEYNFAFSGAWAAYAFTGYRAGMRDKAAPREPRIALAIGSASIRIVVSLAWQSTHQAEFAACVVLGHVDGRRAFHALGHGPGMPDFHDRSCFLGVLGGRDVG